MNWFNNVFVPAAGTIAVIVIGATIVVAVFHDARQAPGAVKRAYRWFRFHCGPVRADGAPLNQDEKAAFARIRRRYSRPAAPEYVYEQQQEDWS